MAPRRPVSSYEWFSQLGKLSGKVRRRRRLRSEYFRYMSFSYWRPEEREKWLAMMRHIRITEIPILEEEIDRERRAIAEKIPPPPKEELIGDESCSGMDIYYYPAAKTYRVRDPETYELIREEDKIAVALTASISTDVGHDIPITLEITAVTYVTEMSPSDITAFEKTLEQETMNWLREQGWGALLRAFEKVGIEFNGETHVNAVKLYPFTVPDYPKIHFFVERRSRYMPKREYEGETEIE